MKNAFFVITIITVFSVSSSARADEFLRWNERAYTSCNESGAQAAARKYGDTYELARAVQRSCNRYLMRMRDSESYRKTGIADTVLAGNISIIQSERRKYDRQRY
jgi:hypothetical protein